MSGNVPDFIYKDHYILSNGKERLVTDYYFTAGDGVHNSDVFVAVLDGMEKAGRHDCQPLAAQDIPEWLEKDKVVEFVAFGQTEHRAVKAFWGKKEVGQKHVETIVSVDGYTPMPLSKFSPVSPTFQRQADVVQRAWNQTLVEQQARQAERAKMTEEFLKYRR